MSVTFYFVFLEQKLCFHIIIFLVRFCIMSILCIHHSSVTFLSVQLFSSYRSCFYPRSLFHVALCVCEESSVKIKHLFACKMQSQLCKQHLLKRAASSPHTLRSHTAHASQWSVLLITLFLGQHHPGGFIVRLPPQRVMASHIYSSRFIVA